MLITLLVLSPFMIRKHNRGEHADKPRKICLKCHKEKKAREAAAAGPGSG